MTLAETLDIITTAELDTAMIQTVNRRPANRELQHWAFKFQCQMNTILNDAVADGQPPEACMSLGMSLLIVVFRVGYEAGRQGLDVL